MSTTVDLGKITASVTVGTTTTGAAGTNASVSNSGTTQDAVLNFTIPRGAQGVQGPQGSTGPAGPAGPTGPQGPMGDVAVITPEQQAAFTMYSVTGQNTDGPMTQKAVTDALENKIDGQSEIESSWDFALSDANGNIVFCIKDGHVITKNFKSSALTIGVADLDKENCAYAVTDSNGNMAFVITEDGHLVTKNFNSRSVSAESIAILEKLANLVTKFNGKTMAVIGDSISTYSGYTPSGWRVYYPTGNVNNVSATYWYQVATTLGMTPLNCAYSASYATGDSTQTEVSSSHEQGECAGCSEVRIASLTRDGNTPDIVLILLGTNDYQASRVLGSWTEHSAIPSEGTINQFSSAYALMLHKIKTALPNTRIFCCTILQRNFSFPEKTISVKDYNDVIKEMASIFGCDVIDTYACGISRYNIGSYTVDGAVHPNVAGHKLIADKIITELISKY